MLTEKDMRDIMLFENITGMTVRGVIHKTREKILLVEGHLSKSQEKKVKKFLKKHRIVKI